MKTKYHIDLPLILVVLILLAIGIIMVYSSSSMIALVKLNDSAYYLKKQIVRVLLGIAVLLILVQFDYHRFKKLAIPGLLIGFILLIYVLIAKDIEKIRGVSRWVRISFINIQPSEFMKYAMVFYFADVLDRKKEQLSNFLNGYLPIMVILGTGALLILLEPDLSTSVVLVIICMGLFFVGGIKLSYLAVTTLACLPAVVTCMHYYGYQKERFFAYLNPQADPLGKGYQIIQSLISLGNGGLLGEGLGQSKQKLFYLPAPHTDFIFSILGEELGFIGTTVIIILFLLLLWRGISIARKAPDNYGTLLGIGITLTIIIPAFINMAVVCNLIPTTGLSIPFISFGGSSIFATLAGVGVLLNISSQKDKSIPGMKRVRNVSNPHNKKRNFPRGERKKNVSRKS